MFCQFERHQLGRSVQAIPSVLSGYYNVVVMRTIGYEVFLLHNGMDIAVADFFRPQPKLVLIPIVVTQLVCLCVTFHTINCSVLLECTLNFIYRSIVTT